ncbi:MAG: hypothetical protein JSW61_11255 [Candidatus Thorarchaeota archaeon]|nr:MAG: hypothetical protein JSW61_11255 [Candidatus Thorarchaeota archaeon]
MSEERIERFIAEQARDLVRQSAGNKFLREADALMEKGDFAGADKLLVQAADAFVASAQEYRDGKSYKKSAILMCTAGDVLSDIGYSERAVSSYALAADDLLGAAREHLMWEDDMETKKGTALAVASAMILLMIGQDAEGFHRARTFASENASRIRFPDVIRLSQIPQQLETAIQTLDLASFSSAENAIVTELKAALVGGDAASFSTYVDKGMDMVRETLRGRLKVPKVVSQLELPVDMTFTEQFPLRAVIKNTGEGEALNLSAEWHVDDGIAIVSGEKKTQMPRLDSGESLTLEITAKSKQADLMGAKEYSIMVRGTYGDKLSTEYSLQAGPGALILKDFKEAEKLRHDIDVTDSRLGLLRDTIEVGDLEKEPLHRIAEAFSDALQQARGDLGQNEIESAKTRIALINQLLESVDSLLGDDALSEKLVQAREAEKRAHTMMMLESLSNEVGERIDRHKRGLEDDIESAKEKWNSEASKKKEIVGVLSEMKESLAESILSLESVYNKLPTASSTTDPDEAASRTRLRSAMDDSKAKLAEIQNKVSRIAADDFLTGAAEPDVPPTVKAALESLSSIKAELDEVLASKKRTME